MQPEEYYRKKIQEVQDTLKRYRAWRDGLTAGKIVLLAAMLYLLYLLARDGEATRAWGAATALLLFIACNVVESRLLARIAFAVKLKTSVEIELEYLAGDCSRLDPGEEFRDRQHPYSHDLDIFGEASIFRAINRTVTPRGRAILAGWLACPSRSREEIVARQEAVRELGQEPGWCLDFRATGHARALAAPVEEHAGRWQRERVALSTRWFPFLYILPAIVLGGWLLCLPGVISYHFPLYGSLLLLGIVAWHGRAINRVHRQLELFIRSFGTLHALTRQVERLHPRSARLRSLHDTLFGEGHDSRVALASLHRALEAFDQRGNLLAAILLNGLYMKDLHLLARLARWQERHAACLPAWIEATGELDALTSLAVHAFNHPGHVMPVVQEECLLRATALGHPLLPAARRVTNDFRVERLHEFHVITGANMAGKSTFLRAVGVNLVLAHCGSVVCASALAFRPVTLFSSMRVADDLASGTSYFLAELTRLKHLMELAVREEHLFIILDEILKGTNSVDKLEGSLRVLRKLRTLPVAGIVATHDLELGNLATLHPGNYVNHCFEITHDDDTIVYDYTLRPGVSRNMNASILLEKMALC
jgi:hypothetical protein